MGAPTDPGPGWTDPERALRTFDELPLAVIAADGDDLRIAVANAAARRLGGPPLLGARTADVLSPVVARRVLPVLDEVRATGLPREVGETLVELPAPAVATPRWVRWAVTPQSDPAGVVVYGEDVTSAVQARAADREASASTDDEHAAALEVVAALQGALLPSSVPVLPCAAIAATYLVAGRGQGAGGDWFDAAVTPDGRLSLVVGDVVGHGVAASAVMCQLRAVLAGRLLDGAGVVEALAALDRYAAVLQGSFATTVCAALLDTSTGELEYATRGHPAPVVASPSGWRQLPPSGDGPLGTPGRDRSGRASLADDEVLVLFTDGIVERPGRRLQDGVAALGEASVEAVRGAVLDVLSAPTAAERTCLHVPWVMSGDGYVDDLTVLAVNRRPRPADLDVQHTATAGTLADVRADVDAWTRSIGMEPDARSRLVLAASEAVANVVEHAYRGRPPGPVRVQGTLRDDSTVVMCVADEGTWQPPSLDPAERGRGLAMVAGAGIRFTVDAQDGGTRVRFEVEARRRAPLTPLAAARAVPPAGGLVLTSDGDGTVHVGGAVDHAEAAARLDAEVRRAARGGLVPVVISLGEDVFLGSAAVRVLELLTRGPESETGDVRVLATSGSPAASTLKAAGTPHGLR